MTVSPTTPTPDAAEPGLLSPALRATTVGMVALVVLYAFDTLALASAMPRIAEDLDGTALYAMAFSATLAAGVVSVVYGGNLCDRSGPAFPLQLGLGLFALGLVVAAFAPSMPVLVASRAVQGLGAGLTSVALYVMLALVYPDRLRVPMMAAFSAAWVLPSLFGPPVAGLLTQTLGWRWVFGLSAVVLGAATWLLRAPLSALVPVTRPQPWRWPALVGAVVVAAAVVTLTGSAQAFQHGVSPTGLAVLLVAAVAMASGARVLLPRGTLRLASGVPAQIAMRTLSFGALAGSEIYLPRLLTERDGLSAVTAGSILSTTGITWFLGSWVQGRWSERMPLARTYVLAMSAVVIGLTGVAWTIAQNAAIPVMAAAFAFVGLGLGTIYPRVSSSALAQTPPEQHGFISSAIQIGDQAGGALALALGAVVFAVTGADVEATVPTAFVAVFLTMAAVAGVALLAAVRVGPTSPH